MIGVLGTGLMGKAIAIEIAKAGKNVIVYSAQRHLSDDKLKEEMLTVIMKSKIDNIDFVTSKIKIAHDLNEFKDCTLIIEALKEDLDFKRNILVKLPKESEHNTIYCSNTSSLSIEKIFENIVPLTNVVGFHFFNPPSIMKLVEVSLTSFTNDEFKNYVLDFANEIGKEPIVVKNSPGFVVNKLLIPYINQAAILLENNIASIEDIDKAMILGANHPIGPFKLADLIGIDVILAILNTFKESNEGIYISSILKNMVNDNKLGRKTKIGFYDYSIKK